MAKESKRAVIAAIAGNLAIAAIKFGAAGVTGSSAMLAEGIHSLVDTGNGALMLLGMWRSKRPPDEMHPYGFGKALYFWTLIVAFSIFGVGGGVSIYEGILHLAHPHPPENVGWSYAVIGLAAIFESISFGVAFHAFRKSQGDLGVWEAVKKSRDPTTYSVLFEDSAALAGLVAAFVGIFLADTFRAPVFDGLASIVIGATLVTAAVLLANQARGLIVGEGMEPEQIRGICAVAAADPAVVRTSRPMTMYFGPETVLLTMAVDFRDDVDLEAAIAKLGDEIRATFPQIRYVFLEARELRAPRPEDGRRPALAPSTT